MTIRSGRRGKFLGCSGYPKCKNTMELPAKLLEELGLNSDGQANERLAKDEVPAARQRKNPRKSKRICWCDDECVTTNV